MKKTLLFVRLFIIIFISVAFFANDPNFTYAATSTITVPSNVPGGFENALLSLPDGYDPNSSTTYPLFVFMHGKGGYSTDYNAFNTASNSSGWVNPKDGQTYKFIVVAPHFTDTSRSQTGAEVDSIVQWMVNHYQINTNRIYLTGLSYGGAPVFEYATRTGTNPMYKAAAVAPMSMSSAPTQAKINQTIADAVHVWGFGGGSETEGAYVYVYVNGSNSGWQCSDGPCTGLGSLGRSTIVPFRAHCCWNEYYDPNARESIIIDGTNNTVAQMNLYEWMLQFSRSAGGPPPNFSPSATVSTSTPSITLPNSTGSLTGSCTDPEGALSSCIWTKLSGPAATITNTTSGTSSTTTSVTGMTTAGTYVFRLTATDTASQTGYSDVTITVNAQPGVSTPYGGTARSITSTIQAEDFDVGGQGTAYNDVNTNNLGGSSYRPSEGVDIETYGTNLYNVSHTINGEWMKYSVTAPTTGNYTLSVRAASLNSYTKSVQLYVDDMNTPVATIPIGYTNGWATWQNFVSSSVSLSSGTHTIKLGIVTGSNTDTAYGFNLDSFTFTSGTVNQPPVSNAGADQTITGTSVSLSGTATDPDQGDTVTVLWTKISGPSSYTITNPTNLSTTVTALTQGTYTFWLTATDNHGSSHADAVSVTVNASSVTATANAGTNQTITLPTTSVTLSGSGTVSTGTPIYAWTQVSGTTATIASPSTASTNITGLTTTGARVFRLTVTSTSGGTPATSDVTITVSSTVPPVSNLPSVGLGEYTTHFIDTAGRLTAIGNRGFTGVGGNGSAAGASGTPEPVLSAANTPVPAFKQVAGHFHGAAGVDVNGRVWTMGATAGGESGLGDCIPSSANCTYSPYARMISTDISGAQFDDVASVVGISQTGAEDVDKNGWIAVKNDGSLWIWGTPGALRGNGTELPETIVQRPTRIDIPGCASGFKQVTGGYNVNALCNDGTVWTWGIGYYPNLGYGQAGITGYKTPHQINLSNITQVTGGNGVNFAINSSGQLYGWGLMGAYLGDESQFPQQVEVPTLMTNLMSHLPASVSKIATNHSTVYALLTDGSLWSWGDNTQAGIGNGQSYYGTPAHGYSYDYDVHLVQVLPYHVAPGKTFKNVFDGNLLAHYVYAVGTDNQMYTWGPNRAAQLADRIEAPISGSLSSAYDNSWNRFWPTPVNPFNITSAYISTSPTCLDSSRTIVYIPGTSTDVCNTYSIPSYALPNVGPTASTAGTTTSITGGTVTLHGETSADAAGFAPYTGFISYYEWSQLSGPSTAVIDLPASPTPTVSGLVTGTYVFQLKVTDNGWLTSTANVTVNVNCGGSCPVGAPVINNLSVSSGVAGTSVTINGSNFTASANTVNFGSTAISNLSSNTTSISFTIPSVSAGSYSVSVTNANGTSNASAFTVTVVNTPPTVDAIASQTITLPTSSVSVTALGHDAEGQVTYLWTKPQGETANISSPTNSSTSITGLSVGVHQFYVTVSDIAGASAQASFTVTVLPAPQPPTAYAGSDQTINLPYSSVTLSGSGTVSSGSPTYGWTQVSGTAANINSPSTSSTNITNLTTVGVRIFRLTVTDNTGATATSDVTITVNPDGNHPPVVTVSANQTITLPTNSVTISGSATDQDGDTITSYTWTKESTTGTGVITAPGSQLTTVTNLSVGVHQFRLTATDSHGLSGGDELTITVNPRPNQNPIAVAGGPQTIVLPTSQVTLDGSGSSDPDGTINTYAWTQVSGTAATIEHSSYAETNVTGLTTEGVRVFRLTVTDNQGGAATSDVTITVNPPLSNQPPVVTVPIALTLTLPTSFAVLSGSATDPDGDLITSYAWTEVGGTGAIITPTNLSTTTVSGLTVGSHTFRLTATDIRGASGNNDVTITVNPNPNIAPVAVAGGPQTIVLPTSQVTLTGSGSDLDNNTPLSYAWTKVSGPTGASITSLSAASTTVTGLTQGVYIFRLVVTDSLGLPSLPSDVTVTVSPELENRSPVVTVSANQTITLPTSSVTISGSATDPDTDAIATYAWTQVSGAATITTPLLTTTTITGLTQGSHTFRLTATDVRGGVGSKDVTITVNGQQSSGGGGGGGGNTTPVIKFTVPPVVSNKPIVNTLPAGLTRTSIPVLGIKKGISGAGDVRILQLFLNWNLGTKLVPQLTVDGKFGNAVTNAVKLFQSSNRLVVDGVFGRGNAALATQILNGTTSTPTPLPPVTNGGTKPSITLPTIGVKRGVNDTLGNVTALQIFLNWYVKPTPLLTVDGKWGLGTTNAIRAFQTKVGATPDGSFGPKTALLANQLLK